MTDHTNPPEPAYIMPEGETIVLSSSPQWEIMIGGKNGFSMILSQIGDSKVTYPNRLQRWFLRKFFAMNWVDLREKAND